MNAQQEKSRLDKAALNEADSRKQAAYLADAEIQTMKAQESQSHVVNIKRWKPPAEQQPAVIPQSRVVPQPSPENRRQVQKQVRDQVQRDVQIERQHEQNGEEMVRRVPPLQANNKAVQPQRGERR